MPSDRWVSSKVAMCCGQVLYRLRPLRRLVPRQLRRRDQVGGRPHGHVRVSGVSWEGGFRQGSRWRRRVVDAAAGAALDWAAPNCHQPSGERHLLSPFANSAFHPSGVGRWVVIHVVTWITRVATIKRQIRAGLQPIGCAPALCVTIAYFRWWLLHDNTPCKFTFIIIIY